MKKVIAVAVIVAGGIVFAACGGGSSSPSTTDSTAGTFPTTTTTFIPSTTQPTTGGTQGYLNEVQTQSDLANVSSSTLVSLGNAACGDFDNGYSVEQVAQDGLNAVEQNPGLGISDHDIGFIIGAAVVNICPQYTQEVQSYLNSNSASIN